MEVGGVKTCSAAGGVGEKEEINWGLPDDMSTTTTAGQ
jgi:hypothetical protein